MFSYVFGVLRRRGWAVLSVTIVLVVAVGLRTTGLDPLLELDKCPLCYGVNGCDIAKQIQLNLYDPGTLLSYLFGIRNVFHGFLGQKRVVVKKLADRPELQAFDRQTSQGSNNFDPCGDKNDTKLYKLIEKAVSVDFKEDHLSRLRVCPTIKHLKSFINSARTKDGTLDDRTFLCNVWTVLSLNPEPLLLQILSNDWPVAKYLGACGRVIVEEYAGASLVNYYRAPLLVRLKIARSLLDSAYKFTFKDDRFGYYLTDVSADNVAVDTDDSAVFVDLENVIVVVRDISAEDEPIGWSETHSSDFSDSKDLTFSPEEICGHKFSDHNYYAICQLIFNTGLLRDASQPNLSYLLEKCLRPEPEGDRINAGIELTKVLDKVIKRS